MKLREWAQVIPAQQFFEPSQRELLERVDRVFLLMAGIEVRGLAKAFREGARALERVDLDVADGELLVLVGPSGSGKTTLLRLIAGLDAPTAGTIRIAGKDLAGVPPHQRDIALVFQNLALYGHLSVAENLAFGRSHETGEPSTEQIEETAELLKMGDLLKRYPAELSGGEQQRVALGRAIVRRPAALLLDEPLSSLDGPTRRDLRRLLKQLQRKLDIPTIYVTHDQTEALALGDRIAMLHAGRLCQVGTPAEVFWRPANVLVGNFFGPQGLNLIDGKMQRQGNTATFEAGGWRIELDPAPPRGIAGAACCGFRPVSLLPGYGDLVGRVTAVESLGEAIYVQVELPSSDERRQYVVARQQNLDMQPPRPGSLIPLSLDQSRLLWFDPATGKRIS